MKTKLDATHKSNSALTIVKQMWRHAQTKLYCNDAECDVTQSLCRNSGDSFSHKPVVLSDLTFIGEGASGKAVPVSFRVSVWREIRSGRAPDWRQERYTVLLAVDVLVTGIL